MPSKVETRFFGEDRFSLLFDDGILFVQSPGNGAAALSFENVFSLANLAHLRPHGFISWPRDDEEPLSLPADAFPYFASRILFIRETIFGSRERSGEKSLVRRNPSHRAVRASIPDDSISVDGKAFWNRLLIKAGIHRNEVSEEPSPSDWRPSTSMDPSTPPLIRRKPLNTCQAIQDAGEPLSVSERLAIRRNISRFSELEIRPSVLSLKV